jgi:hypothetical protein
MIPPRFCWDFPWKELAQKTPEGRLSGKWRAKSTLAALQKRSPQLGDPMRAFDVSNNPSLDYA